MGLFQMSTFQMWVRKTDHTQTSQFRYDYMMQKLHNSPLSSFRAIRRKQFHKIIEPTVNNSETILEFFLQ